MPRDGTVTRDKILVAAQSLILEQGYGGMSLDGVIERAGITKGAFFYHFANKQALARALMERYAQGDQAHYEDTAERADKLTRDPVQQLLVFAGLLIDELQDSDMSEEGCLYAAFCYQTGLIEEESLEIARDSMRYWRKHFGQRAEAALAKRKTRIPVTAQDLVDQLLVAFEGGFIMARSMKEGDQLAKALRHYRNYLELLFALEPSSSPGAGS